MVKVDITVFFLIPKENFQYFNNNYIYQRLYALPQGSANHSLWAKPGPLSVFVQSGKVRMVFTFLNGWTKIFNDNVLRYERILGNSNFSVCKSSFMETQPHFLFTWLLSYCRGRVELLPKERQMVCDVHITLYCPFHALQIAVTELQADRISVLGVLIIYTHCVKTRRKREKWTSQATFLRHSGAWIISLLI